MSTPLCTQCLHATQRPKREARTASAAVGRLRALGEPRKQRQRFRVVAPCRPPSPAPGGRARVRPWSAVGRQGLRGVRPELDAAWSGGSFRGRQVWQTSLYIGGRWVLPPPGRGAATISLLASRPRECVVVCVCMCRRRCRCRCVVSLLWVKERLCFWGCLFVRLWLCDCAII